MGPRLGTIYWLLVKLDRNHIFKNIRNYQTTYPPQCPIKDTQHCHFKHQRFYTSLQCIYVVTRNS